MKTQQHTKKKHKTASLFLNSANYRLRVKKPAAVTLICLGSVGPEA